MRQLNHGLNDTVDDLVNRLAQGGQVDILPARHFHIVHTNQPDVSRTGQSGIGYRRQGADGNDIIAAEIGLGPCAGQQPLHFRPPSIKGVIGRERGAQRHIGIGGNRLLEPAQTVAG